MGPDYNPKPKNAEWLTWALQKAKALPYKPTARWVFYRLVQERGFKKKQYKKFLKMTSRARKGFWNGWDPDSLADDTRAILKAYGSAHISPASWFESFRKRQPVFEVAQHQENIVIVCFEAKAMVGQFNHYLDPLRVCQCPFGGDASIPYKSEIAGLIDSIYKRWPDKDIYVLYYGDYDSKGFEIPENAMRDIEAWCGATVEYVRCGLNEEHIKRYSIPDSPDAPGKYQWEAVPDDIAREMILNNVLKYWDSDVVQTLKAIEQRCSQIWEDVVDTPIAQAKESMGETDLEFEEDEEGDADED